MMTTKEYNNCTFVRSDERSKNGAVIWLCECAHTNEILGRVIFSGPDFLWMYHSNKKKPITPELAGNIQDFLTNRNSFDRRGAFNAKEERYPLPGFEVQLRDLINTYNVEVGSDTPEYILAEYLTSCLAAFDVAVNKRKKHDSESITHVITGPVELTFTHVGEIS